MNGFMEGEEKEDGQEVRTAGEEEGRDLQDRDSLSPLHLPWLPGLCPGPRVSEAAEPAAPQYMRPES